MNINEEQNRAKLIKLRKRHLIVKQQFYKSFGKQYRLHLHFYLLWKERIACALKTWWSWINVSDASFWVLFHALEHEMSLSNNATPIQSELIRMFFITYDEHERCFFLWEQKPSHLTAPFNAVVLKRIWLRILIVTNKYSWPNWDQRKSPDNREIRIIEVRLYMESIVHIVIPEYMSYHTFQEEMENSWYCTP